jgi:anthranilate phosphoribosyltransferase
MAKIVWPMRPYLHAVGTGPKSNRDLTYDEARQVADLILDQEATALQHGAFLIALRNKGESPDELRAFVDAVRDRSTVIEPGIDGLVDIGSPYDGRTESLVVSPLASIVAAAAGAPQVMHGAPDMPPKHGTGVHEVLQALGLAVDLPPSQVEALIEREGFGYMNQEVFSPSLFALKQRREEMTLRSAFNTVEKMANLASAQHHIIGLTHTPYLHRITGAMSALGYGRSFIVQGIEGNEDISTWRAGRLVILEDEGVEESRLDPADFEIERVEIEDIRAKDPLRESLDKLLPVLECQGEPGLRDLVAYNAGLRIWLSGTASSMADGIADARRTIASGAAQAKLSALRSRSPILR